MCVNVACVCDFAHSGGSDAVDFGVGEGLKVLVRRLIEIGDGWEEKTYGEA